MLSSQAAFGSEQHLFIVETANIALFFRRAAAGVLDWLGVQTQDTNSGRIPFVGGEKNVPAFPVFPGAAGQVFIYAK